MRQAIYTLSAATVLALLLSVACTNPNTEAPPAAGADSQVPQSTTPPLPKLGERQKLRFFFTQWHHFTKDRQQLMTDLGKVGATVFADWGCSPDSGRLAHENGIHYFCGFATAQMRGPTQTLKTRLAVDKTGRTCPERFEAYVAEGGDPSKPWGSWGEGHGAFVPCPLDKRPWDEALKPVIEHARQGWVDGLNLDFEPYGAYAFDNSGDMLCYCDDCFGRYLKHKKIDQTLPRAERYQWLVDEKLIDDYCLRLHHRMIDLYKAIAADLRAVRPGFTFSAYGVAFEHAHGDMRHNWRGLALPLGTSTPDAPFISVDSTPYWEDPPRRWWDGMHLAYRKLGIRHVMGSWDAGIMGHHLESHVGAADLMYEVAMATDGFWRWGEREYDTNDWRSFAMANQRLRRVENRLGDFIFDGSDVRHFVTLVEQTGNPLLDTPLFARTWQREDRYLVRIFNGNTDWPLHVRVRLPRPGGEGPFRLRDAMHDVDYVPDGGGTWSTDDLFEGLVVAIEGRGELFLLLEPATRGYAPDRERVVNSLTIDTHQQRPPADTPLPDAEPAGDDTVVYSSSANIGYRGQTAHLSYGTVLFTADVNTGEARRIMQLQGYCRQPRFSADRKKVAASVYVNGRGQIYLSNAVGGGAQNISGNDYCDRSPVFTPDGQRIVFVSDRHGQWDIYSMNIDGSDVQRLTDSPAIDRSPEVSPDGTQIAFLSNRDTDFDVHLMNIDGSDQRAWFFRLGHEYDHTWSPDGRKLACSLTARNVRWMQVGDAGGENVLLGGWDLGTDISSIRFSPDGKQIAGAFRQYNMSGIFIGAADDATTATKLIEVDSIKSRNDQWYTTGSGSPRYVTPLFSGVHFSPDGSKLLYCSDHSSDRSFRLHTIPAAGGDATELTGPASAWPMSVDW